MKSCFVVMGYGIKRIPDTSIKLNLNDIYFNFIKPVLLEKKLHSIYHSSAFRGDEVPTTIAINQNFIQSVFLADIVIADISILNQNAIYELGLRHAMKKKSTIILREESTIETYPFFDISMSPQLRYDSTLLLNDQYYREGKQKELHHLIDSCINSDQNYIDSPVFSLNLYDVRPSTSFELLPVYKSMSLNDMLSKAKKLQEENKFSEAESQYKKILEKSFDIDTFSKYILCKYKKELSTANLLESLDMINKKIDLDSTTHEDLLGIAGAINKNLFKLTSEEQYLEYSLLYYKKGTNFETGNLYCARNYCSNLLKRYLVTNDLEIIKEHYYTAIHFAKFSISQSVKLRRNSTNFDDAWYQSNLRDLQSIAQGNFQSIFNIFPTTIRQKETINNGATELKIDYLATLKIIK